MITNQEILDLCTTAEIAGYDLQPGMLQIEHLLPGMGHQQGALPNGQMAVYCFFQGAQALKIGKANTGSNPRYQYQHYLPNSYGSVLAKSLLNDPQYLGQFNQNTVGDCIKNNVIRYNIVLSAQHHRNILHFIEAFLILKFEPKYEAGT